MTLVLQMYQLVPYNMKTVRFILLTNAFTINLYYNLGQHNNVTTEEEMK